MPLKRCTVDGKKGWKWGDSGKCYTGPNAREKALTQMRAIKSQQSKSRIDKLLEQIAAIIEKKS